MKGEYSPTRRVQVCVCRQWYLAWLYSAPPINRGQQTSPTLPPPPPTQRTHSSLSGHHVEGGGGGLGGGEQTELQIQGGGLFIAFFKAIV